LIVTLENRFFSLRSAVCFIIEGGIIILSVVASFLLLHGRAGTPVVSMGDVVARALVVTFFCQACMYLLDLYNFKLSRTWGEVLFGLAIAIGFVCIGIGMLSYAIPKFGVAGTMYYLSILIASVFLLLWRIVFEIYINRYGSRENILIVGTGDVARQVGEEVKKRKRLGFHLVGFIDAPPAKNGTYEGQVGDILGDPSQMERIIKRYDVDKVVVAITERRGEYPVKEMLSLRVRGHQVVEWPGFFEKLSGRIPIDNLAPSFFIFNEGFRKSRILLSIRRVLSAIVAAIVLVLLLPVFLVVGVFIKLDSPGSVFYSQIRVGRYNKPIRIYKFRSMCTDAEKNGDAVWAVENDPRVTRVGRFLRKTRIDELPQMFNVLVGELEFVGPRPERPEFVEKLQSMIPYYSLRHTVKPGISGWAQVMFHYGSTIDESKEKLQYDLFYIKNMSLKLDLLILFHTVKIVLLGRGAR
jgi:sugar transferase (PEP-CTERM system associated)